MNRRTRNLAAVDNALELDGQYHQPRDPWNSMAGSRPRQRFTLARYAPLQPYSLTFTISVNFAVGRAIWSW
jgi:hypothetical protein